YRFHGLRFLSLAVAFAYRMPAKFRNADLRGKKNCGARFPPTANAAKIREFFADSRRGMLWYLTTRAIMTVSFRAFHLRFWPVRRFRRSKSPTQPSRRKILAVRQRSY